MRLTAVMAIALGLMVAAFRAADSQEVRVHRPVRQAWHRSGSSA